MKEIKGDIFDYIGIADAICVTTNGIVKKDGSLVMGAGIAKAMADKYPDLPKVLGKKVNATGKNIVFKGIEAKDNQGTYILSFPTKNDYRSKSNKELIRRSAIRLKYLADIHKLNNIIIPCPGIGCGGLNKADVINLLKDILDDRFTIITNK